jgi:thiol-disulfide isomerase/thioredoxin
LAIHIGLPIGATAPAFNLPGLDAKSYSLEQLRAERKPVMLVFYDPGCGPCNALLPEVKRWQQEYRSKMSVALISRGDEEVNRPKADQHMLDLVLLQKDREVAESYQAYGTPMAVIVLPDGTIGSSLVGGPEAIGALVANTVGSPIPAPMAVAHGGNGHAHGGATQHILPAPKMGDPAPEINLPNLDSKMVSLSNSKSRKTLILFWNPGCGFCTAMLEELKAWEENPPPDAPALLVVSTGAVAENRAHGFKSTVVLDQGFSVGRLFGASGTPAAVLISATGNIASNVAVGGPAVLALAGCFKFGRLPSRIPLRKLQDTRSLRKSMRLS